MRSRLFLISLTVLTLFSSISFGSGLANADSRVINDLSWPNCGEKLNDLSFSGIVGINDGLDFSENPCLSYQSQLFHGSYGLYLNTGYSGLSYALKYTNYPKDCSLSNSMCLAYNWGYNDALYSIDYADNQDVHSFAWWLDVEIDNSWSTKPMVNRQALIGMTDAISKNTFMPIIGFYAYPGQWKMLTSSWKNYYPAWVATGLTTKPMAIKYCATAFNGGSVWLAQYTTKLDDNYVCLNRGIDYFKVM